MGGAHAGRDRLTLPSVPWSDVSLPCLKGHTFLLFHILLCLPLLLPLPHPSSLLLLYTSVHYLAKFVLPHFLQPSSHHGLALGLHSLTPTPLVNRLVQGEGEGAWLEGGWPTQRGLSLPPSLTYTKGQKRCQTTYTSPSHTHSKLYLYICLQPRPPAP